MIPVTTDEFLRLYASSCMNFSTLPLSVPGALAPLGYICFSLFFIDLFDTRDGWAGCLMDGNKSGLERKQLVLSIIALAYQQFCYRMVANKEKLTIKNFPHQVIKR